ncbi:hypothetical protein F4806DRAFT_501679 [Annulohypoxylon nitens]|nr:hypothetical protein F4806DRAFT_501679 [Annulohypoxylon nitens]
MSGHQSQGIVLSTFPLITPEGDDERRVTISSFKELFTFLGREVTIDADPQENHPDIQPKQTSTAISTKATDGMHDGVSDMVVSAMTGPLIPQATRNTLDVKQHSDNTSSSESGESDKDENLVMHLRSIVLPGCPPAGVLMTPEERAVQRIRHVHLPENCFENLCIAAIEENYLKSIQTARFVTDTDTLWGLFAAIDSRLSGSRHGSNKKSEPGFTVAVNVVNETIFMKIMNLHHCDDWINEAITAHMK